MSTYLASLGTTALLYCLLALGLNLQWGHAGLLNFGHIAFFGIGAYAFALGGQFGMPLIAALLLGSFAAATISLVLGFASLRLRTDYLAVVTLAFAEAFRIILSNVPWFGGPNGITGVPRLFGEFDAQTFSWLWLALLSFTTLAIAGPMLVLVRSPFGRVLRAIRDDEVAVAGLGRSVFRFETLTLVIGSAIAGLAGGLYASWVGYIVPSQFVPMQTFYVWIGIILGGSSIGGALLGTFAITALLEGTRFLKDVGVIVLAADQVASVRLLVVGAMLILLVRFKPAGLRPFDELRSARNWLRNQPGATVANGATSDRPRASVKAVQ